MHSFHITQLGDNYNHCYTSWDQFAKGGIVHWLWTGMKLSKNGYS